MHKMQEQGKSIILFLISWKMCLHIRMRSQSCVTEKLSPRGKTKEADPNTVIKEMVGRELTNIYPVCEKKSKILHLRRRIFVRMEDLTISISISGKARSWVCSD